MMAPGVRAAVCDRAEPVDRRAASSAAPADARAAIRLGTRAVAAAASGARRTARGRQTSRCWLARRQRQVIELLKFEDLSVRDVATRLGMSEANVKVTAHRGYRALRRQIEEWTRVD